MKSSGSVMRALRRYALFGAKSTSSSLNIIFDPRTQDHQEDSRYQQTGGEQDGGTGTGRCPPGINTHPGSGKSLTMTFGAPKLVHRGIESDART